MSVLETAVSVDGLVKTYGKVTAVDGVDLDIYAGEIFGLLGPNGAGKSTTIETLVGLRTPGAGTVRVLGLDPGGDRAGLREMVTIQPQEAAMFPTQTVAETLRLWAALHTGSRAPEEIMRALDLDGSRDVQVRRLSGGQRQRLLVATAMISRPRLMILDEPSTGLDPNARDALWEAVRDCRAAGSTVLLSTHAMEEAHALCDRLAIVDHGKVVACGAPDDLIRTHAPYQEITFTSGAAEQWDDLCDLPGVSHVATEPAGGGTRVAVQTSEPDTVLRAVLTGRDGVRDVQTHDGGLGAVFRALTGRTFD
jgi:ABC-2 type transport system ATP-binding protein